jgi:hypothetical protein
VVLRRKTSVPMAALAMLLACVLALIAVMEVAPTAVAQTSSPGASATASASATSASATAGATAVAISAASSVSPSASAGGSATATASASVLAETGGPSHVPALASAAALTLVVSGLAALRLVVRRGAS